METLTQTTTLVTPYLFFGGRAEEAIEFYKTALGAEVTMMMRFSESPEAPPPGMIAPGFENKIMHAGLKVDGADIYLSDGCSAEDAGMRGFSLALTARSVEEAHRAFNALSEGGNVTMPICETFWSPAYGMVSDKFGVDWMVMAQ